MSLEILKNTFFENIQSKKESFHRHYHDTYTIGVTHDGVFKYFNSNKAFYSYRYSTKISNPAEVHGGDSDSWRYTNFYPSNELMAQIYEQIFLEKKLPIFQEYIIDDLRLYNLLCNLFQSVYSKQDEMLIEISLLEALSYLIKNHTFYTKSYDDLFDDKKVVKTSIEYIKDTIDSNISLEQLAQNASMSKYHFLRVFKKELGITPHNYILSQTVQKTVQKIFKGMSLSDASVDTGFSDQSHFTRNFKKIYGYTPSKVFDPSKIILY